ncbi:hypothetical protein ColTof4_14419 [Colletotrichum tofieldiae]|nr:hypothetical protein ColTof3_14861 [Colletotrichum tofieldiae]GKT81996.1 hypothetical protein ColTof4_14419 [Colletotrichum tofieldiae]
MSYAPPMRPRNRVLKGRPGFSKSPAAGIPPFLNIPSVAVDPYLVHLGSLVTTTVASYPPDRRGMVASKVKEEIPLLKQAGHLVKKSIRSDWKTKSQNRNNRNIADLTDTCCEAGAKDLSYLVAIIKIAIEHSIPLPFLWQPGGALYNATSGIPRRWRVTTTAKAALKALKARFNPKQDDKDDRSSSSLEHGRPEEAALDDGGGSGSGPDTAAELSDNAEMDDAEVNDAEMGDLNFWH